MGGGETVPPFTPSPSPPPVPPSPSPPPVPPSPLPPPAPPLMSLVTAAFAVSGTVDDFDAERQGLVRVVVATEASVALSSVALEISSASVAISTTITTEAILANATATSLAAGMFSSPASLESALSAGGVAGVSVTGITAAPTVVALGIGSDGAAVASSDANMGVTEIVAGACGVMFLAMVAWCTLRRHAPESAPPPPPKLTTGASRVDGVPRKRYSVVSKGHEMHAEIPAADACTQHEVPLPPSGPPPPLLDDDWTSQVDPGSGTVYYYNVVTGESTWERPTASGTAKGVAMA